MGFDTKATQSCVILIIAISGTQESGASMMESANSGMGHFYNNKDNIFNNNKKERQEWQERQVRW